MHRLLLDHDQFMLKVAYLHDPLDVTMAFSEVNTTEFRSTLPVLDVGFEHGARTFSLSPDHTSHGVLKQTTAGVSHRLDMWTRFPFYSFMATNLNLRLLFSMRRPVVIS